MSLLEMQLQAPPRKALIGKANSSRVGKPRPGNKLAARFPRRHYLLTFREVCELTGKDWFVVERWVKSGELRALTLPKRTANDRSGWRWVWLYDLECFREARQRQKEETHGERDANADGPGAAAVSAAGVR